MKNVEVVGGKESDLLCLDVLLVAGLVFLVGGSIGLPHGWEYLPVRFCEILEWAPHLYLVVDVVLYLYIAP